MKLLIFGKTGQVATELRALKTQAVQIQALERAQADLCDPAACAAYIASTDADAVINAAAFTAVDQAESAEGQALLVNGTTPGAMAAAAAARALPFLHLSTDYVFAGQGHTAHAPQDAVAPINAYGRSKLAGERAILAAGGQAAILRTSWVFSAHGSNFVKTMLRLSETRTALSVVSDQMGGPTPARDIAATLVAMAQAMLEDKTLGQGGGLWHYAGTPVTSWAGFARETFRLARRNISVNDIPSEAFPAPAPRPLNSRLDCATLTTDFGITPPDWRTGLARVIEDLEKQTP